MKFLNLDNGYSFDGLWTTDQQRGYIFWFPGEQSIGITYTMPIVIIHDDETPIQLSLDNNDVFSFISVDENNPNIPIYTNEILTSVEKVGDTVVHKFNISATAQTVAEYICNVNIGDYGYIKVGIDAYGEDESLYINLSNNGIEIPYTIQKAIYESNVHEDNPDNILVNRKFKELLSNYWDILANKGSYKSLINSIKWFEWDDKLSIKEIYKHYNAGRVYYNDAKILTMLDDNIKQYIERFTKTNYISLYTSLFNELPTYDNEYNPQLERAVFKWSKEDIQLKIALLAQFFGIYFAPVHIGTLHAVAEDIVFTNTIKALHASEIKRDDCFGSFESALCNINNGQSFKLTNVNAQVTNNTVYGVKYPDITHAFGVDYFPTNAIDDVLIDQTFGAQYYSGPGVIIPIEITIPNQKSRDFVKMTVVDYTTDSGEIHRLFLNDHFMVRNGEINIKFNFLAKVAQAYNIRLTFVLGSSNTITHDIKFTVEDTDNLNINVYKIHAKDDTGGLTKEDFIDDTGSYMFKIQNSPLGDVYSQYLPYMLPSNPNFNTYNGIKLTRTVIVDIQNKNELEHKHIDIEINFLRAIMMRDFLEYIKYEYDEDGNIVTDSYGNPKITYIVFISKRFYQDVPETLYNNVYKYKYNIIRNDLCFYPQFHYLEKMDGASIDNYTISQYDAICCAVEINNGNKIEPLRYGHMIDTAEWTFTNNTDNSIVFHPSSSQQPFVANNSKKAITPGYYNISFKYSLTNGVTNECKLNSAFRIKN